MSDDREEFLRESRRRMLAMAADPEVARLDRALTAASDRHDFSYQWQWLGVPIIQMPADVVALQEIIWTQRPTAIVETGVARGGSAIFFASMLRLLGRGRVVAVDIDVRPHNRDTVEKHPCGDLVTLIEGPSTDRATLDAVRAAVGEADRVMVVLDSDHTADHVRQELQAYSPLVTPGQFLVVADTLVEHLPADGHRERPWGPGNNPLTAVHAFLADHGDEWDVDPHVNGKLLLTSSRGGYLRRR